jgi:hypothetical protein
MNRQREKKWDLTLDEEVLYRQNLLLRARGGDQKAQEELMQTYQVRLYSQRERDGLPTDHNPKNKLAKISVQSGVPPSGREKRDVE